MSAADELKKLHEDATRGDCVVAVMAEGSPSTGPYEPVALPIFNSFPRFVRHNRSSYIAACDMQLIAYMKNHASDFAALIEAAEYLVRACDTGDRTASGEQSGVRIPEKGAVEQARKALKPFTKEPTK